MTTLRSASIAVQQLFKFSVQKSVSKFYKFMSRSTRGVYAICTLTHTMKGRTHTRAMASRLWLLLLTVLRRHERDERWRTDFKKRANERLSDGNETFSSPAHLNWHWSGIRALQQVRRRRRRLSRHSGQIRESKIQTYSCVLLWIFHFRLLFWKDIFMYSQLIIITY